MVYKSVHRFLHAFAYRFTYLGIHTALCIYILYIIMLSSFIHIYIYIHIKHIFASPSCTNTVYIYIYICVSVHPFKAEDRNGMKEPTSTSKAGRLVATLLWLWQEARIVWILIVLPWITLQLIKGLRILGQGFWNEDVWCEENLAV